MFLGGQSFPFLAVFQCAWVPTSLQLSWITWSSLASCLAPSRVSGFQQHSSVWVWGFGYVLQCMSLLEALACSIDTDFKGILSGLIQIFSNWELFKKMKNAFYVILKALFIIKINFCLDVATSLTENCNRYIA